MRRERKEWLANQLQCNQILDLPPDVFEDSSKRLLWEGLAWVIMEGDSLKFLNLDAPDLFPDVTGVLHWMKMVNSSLRGCDSPVSVDGMIWS